jgi:hypothetical protein
VNGDRNKTLHLRAWDVERKSGRLHSVTIHFSQAFKESTPKTCSKAMSVNSAQPPNTPILSQVHRAVIVTTSS